jgi:hypothetical protein
MASNSALKLLLPKLRLPLRWITSLKHRGRVLDGVREDLEHVPFRQLRLLA